MPKLLLFSDFPECHQSPKELNCGSVSYLKKKCSDFFQKNTSPANMLCIISDDDDWDVLYPVISSGNGKKEHPNDSRGKGRNKGWYWDSEKTQFDNHRIFTEKLQQSMGEVILAEDYPTAESAPSKESQENRQTSQKLDDLKQTIIDNWNLFLKEYQSQFKRGFDHFDGEMLLRNREPADIAAVQKWGADASSSYQLIDPCAFNEMILGNDRDPDIVILGKNPGAGGIDRKKTSDYFKDVFKQLVARKQARQDKIFYPLLSKETMEDLPWFPNRLFFGSKSDQVYPCGILSKFIDEQKQACSQNIAKKIVSLELVPYHTVRFQNGNKLIRKFGVLDQVKGIVENAVDRKAVILCPYFGAVEMWLDAVEKLKEYPFFYTTHVALGKNDPPQDGNLNINNLRHYSKIRTTRTPDETCEPLFDRLVELGWKRIKR